MSPSGGSSVHSSARGAQKRPTAPSSPGARVLELLRIPGVRGDNSRGHPADPSADSCTPLPTCLHLLLPIPKATGERTKRLITLSLLPNIPLPARLLPKGDPAQAISRRAAAATWPLPPHLMRPKASRRQPPMPLSSAERDWAKSALQLEQPFPHWGLAGFHIPFCSQSPQQAPQEARLPLAPVSLLHSTQCQPDRSSSHIVGQVASPLSGWPKKSLS